MTPEKFVAFMARFFPVFIAGLFSAMFGIAFLSVLWGEVHSHSIQERAQYFLGLIVGFILPLCAGHFFMIRGYGWAIGVIWVIMGISLIMSLSLLASKISVFLGVCVLFQLLSLLALNSKRHREMRARLIELRIERGGT